jgi:hypothetical protein
MPADRQRRHPSSNVDPAVAAACDECGFVPPLLRDTGEALRAVPEQWRDALRKSPLLIPSAARLRDELHAIANRVARLLIEQDARLSSVTIPPPDALAASASTNILVALLRMAAVRLADLVDALRPEQWGIAGRVGDRTVTVAELVRVPLHHSHRDLAARRPGMVVPVAAAQV